MDVWRRYKQWVRRNGNLLSVLETGISSLTWVLPDRFNENELSLEALHTAINLLSSFHDSIINDCAPGAPPAASELAFALNALQHLEVLVELWGVWAQGKGRLSNHYDPLIALEGLKALVRLAIFHSSGTRLLLNGGSATFERFGPGSGGGRGGDARAQEVFAAFAAFRAQHCSVDSDEAVAVQREREDCEQQAEIADIAGKVARRDTHRFWWEEPVRAQPPPLPPNGAADGATPVALPRSLRELELRAAGQQGAAARLLIAGEALHILRPLVYVLALRRWGRGSWKPWTLSLAVELASGRLTAAGAASSRRAAAQAARHAAVAGTSLSPLYGMQGVLWRGEESEELTRRKLLLLYYLVRDPFFAAYTAPAIQRWRERLRRLPLVGWLPDKAAEVLLGAQRYYSYTAAS